MSPRPRASESLILGATRDLVAEHGLAGLNVDAVAAATGVSKATIYRHFESRDNLIRTALARSARASIDCDTGDPREDLVLLMRRLVADLNRRDARCILATAIDASTRDPDIAALHKRNEREGRSGFEQAVRRGVQRGDLPVDTNVRLFVDLVVAPIIYRRVVLHTSARGSVADQIVDLVLAAFTHGRS